MNISERAIQDLLEIEYLGKGYAVRREIGISSGRVDLLCIKGRERILIEVKERKGVKGAIGQLISYKVDVGSTKELLVYFNRDLSYSNISQSIRRACNLNKIEVRDINEICKASKAIEIERYYQGEEVCLTIEEKMLIDTARRLSGKSGWTGKKRQRSCNSKQKMEDMNTETWLELKGRSIMELSDTGLTGQRSDNIMW